MVDYLVFLWSLRWWILIPAVGIVGIKKGGFGEGIWGVVLGLFAMYTYIICPKIADFLYITSPFGREVLCTGIPAIGEIVCIIYIADGFSKKISDILYAICGIILIFAIYKISFFVFIMVMAIVGCYVIHKIYRHFYPKRVIAMPKIKKTKKFKL